MLITTFYMVFSIALGLERTYTLVAGCMLLDIVNMFAFIFVHNMIMQKKADTKIDVLTSIRMLKGNKK